MSLLDQVTPSPRKIMTLFYVVDTSGSMNYDEKGEEENAETAEEVKTAEPLNGEETK